MNPNFRYFVESTNPDGDVSTARFLNATSAYRWAERLRNEGVDMILRKITDSSTEISITFTELKKEAGPCLTQNKKTGRSSRQRF